MTLQALEYDEAKEKSGNFDPALHPHGEGGRFIETGGSDDDDGGDKGGKDKTESNYGLRPGDAAKFKVLKGEWAQINSKLLEHIDKPDGPEAKALMGQLESVVQSIQKLRADPGGVAGIGLPGGPRDVIVVGAGPGGMAASINGALEGLDTLVVEANIVAGGQARYSSRVENFPGFPIGVTGERLTKNMLEQAQRVGAETQFGVRVSSLSYDEKTGLKTLTLADGRTIEGRTIILAGGVEFRRLTFPGADGSGVFVADGKALSAAGKGGNVVVLGGSNGAAQAALGCCAEGAKHVYLMSRSPLEKSMSAYQVDAVRNHPLITVIEGDGVAKLNRDDKGQPESVQTVKGMIFPVDAVGGFLGGVPDTKWVPETIKGEGKGGVHTDPELKTTIPGVYAIGDMRESAIGRIGISVGEGQLALREANRYLDELRKKAAEGDGATAKSYKRRAASPSSASDLIAELFAMDADNPWIGQTVDDKKPPEPKKAKGKSWEERGSGDWDEGKHPRGEGGKWTEGGGGGGGKDDDDGGGGKSEGHPGKGYSASARIIDGVIHTNSVYDAQRALHEDRKVELDQPRSVSVLIQKLGETAKKMIEKGEKAPNFNLCNVSVKGTNLFCADSKGIERIKMPQLDKQQTKDFQKHLKDKGYKVEKEKQFASHLRATQNELIGAKVAYGAEKIVENGGKVKPIIISKDDYVLDGHHAWAAKLGLDAADNDLENDLKMNVVRVNIKITKLLEEANKFTGGKGAKGADEAPNKNYVSFGEVFRDWDESEHPRDEDGKFGAGGGGGDSREGAGYEFVSPNVGELDFGGAVKELGSTRQGVLNDATRDINEQLDIEAQHFDVVGAWKDGAENSTMAVVAHNADWEKMKLSVSMKGWVADQKSVLIFQENDQDNSVLAHFEAQGNLTEIHANLLADGIENHTLVPTATGATVYVADLENTQSAAIKQAALRYGADNPIEVNFGRGEFVGAPYDFKGSDRETRDAARDIYEANIERSPIPGSKEIWQGVHDRWGQALAESDTSLDTRKVYVRPNILKAFEALAAAVASGLEIVSYDGEHVPGTDLIDLAEWDERRLVRRANPKTLYVNRPLLNASEVIDWALSQGFLRTITADDMHVTVAFSSAPVDWDILNDATDGLTVAGGRRSVERFGHGEAVVLLFESDALTKRWQQFVDAGASWDYANYRPHVTIAFDVPHIDVAEIEPFTGKLLFGPEVFSELDDDLNTIERKVDYIQDPATGHLMGSHGSGGDKGDGEKESKDEDKPHEPSPEAMAVGGDEWNKQTAERLEKEYVEAAPKLDKIVKDATDKTVETPVTEEPDPDNAPVVPDSWEMLSGDQQTDVEQQWRDYTHDSYYQNEVDSWQGSGSAVDDAASELAYGFTKGLNKNDEWAADGINEARTVLEDTKIPFDNKQLLNALVVEYEGGNDGNIEKSLDISFDDAKLTKPEGWVDNPTLPGIEPVNPASLLTKEMRETLIAEMTTTFRKAAENLNVDPPEYLEESAKEYQDQVWGDMGDNEKFAWMSDHTDIVSDAQQEYDDYMGGGSTAPDVGKFYMPNKIDPMQEGNSSSDYTATQKVARYVSIERATQILMERGIYANVDQARIDARTMDNSLWGGWKGSSHGIQGQLLQKATADELGGRLNPAMIFNMQSDLERQASHEARNAESGKAYEAVKAYVRAKWETTQFLLKKAGMETVNVYRAVNMEETAQAHAFGPSSNGDYRVSTVKKFETEHEANVYMEKNAADYGKGYTGHVSSPPNKTWFKVVSDHEFPTKTQAETFAEKYRNDPANPEQRTEKVGPSGAEWDRLPLLHVDRNGAASATTDRNVANKWDGTNGRVVLRASVPRTAVVSVPAYGINVQGEHEVVIAGTAWKGWDSWYGSAPPYERIPIGHQIVGHPDAPEAPLGG